MPKWARRSVSITFEIIAGIVRRSITASEHPYTVMSLNWVSACDDTIFVVNLFNYFACASPESRETAYVHAINAAALAWSVTRACSKGELAECSCDNNIRRKARKWQWGGCSEDINYGVMFSRKFIDTQENNMSVEGLLNLHNNEAGRRVSIIVLSKKIKRHQ